MQRLRLGLIAMLNIFSIVIEQFPDIRHHRPLIRIVQRNQRRGAGVLYLLLLPGIPDAGDRLHLHRTFYFQPRIRRPSGDGRVLRLQTLQPLLP